MFDKSADLYDLFYDWKDYRGESERIRQIVEAHSPGARSLLDVACGTGTHLEHLRDWYTVEGLDIDPGLLRVAARRLPGIALHDGDMRADEYRSAFEAAGLSVEHDADGLMGRGLWIAQHR